MSVWVPNFASVPPAPSPEPSKVKTEPESRPRVSVLFNQIAPTATQASASGPAVLKLAGTFTRHRIAVTVADLKLYSPNEIEDAVMTDAVELVITTNLDLLTLNTFDGWGVSAQETAAALAKDLWDLANHPVRQSVLDLSKEIATLIAESDAKPEPKGLWSILDTALVGKIAPKVISMKDRVNLVQNKSAVLQGSMRQLESLTPRVDEVEGRRSSVTKAVKMYSVAGRFIEARLKAKPDVDPALATLQRRLESLAVTELTLAQEKSQIELLKKNTQYNSQVVMDTVVNLIPLWCSKCSIAASATPDPEAPALMSRIVRVLKGEV